MRSKRTSAVVWAWRSWRRSSLWSVVMAFVERAFGHCSYTAHVKGAVMPRMPGRRFALLGALAALVVWSTMPAMGQSAAKAVEWRTYGADLANTRYSPLDQINAANFKTLEVAWRFK